MEDFCEEWEESSLEKVNFRRIAPEITACLMLEISTIHWNKGNNQNSLILILGRFIASLNMINCYQDLCFLLGAFVGLLSDLFSVSERVSLLQNCQNKTFKTYLLTQLLLEVVFQDKSH